MGFFQIIQDIISKKRHWGIIIRCWVFPVLGALGFFGTQLRHNFPVLESKPFLNRRVFPMRHVSCAAHAKQQKAEAGVAGEFPFFIHCCRGFYKAAGTGGARSRALGLGQPQRHLARGCRVHEGSRGGSPRSTGCCPSPGGWHPPRGHGAGRRWWLVSTRPTR